MTEGMIIVFGVLAGAVALFASGRVRPHVVAILVILALNLSGVLTKQEAPAGCLAVVFVPDFFVVLQRLDERRRGKPKPQAQEMVAASPGRLGEEGRSAAP